MHIRLCFVVELFSLDHCNKGIPLMLTLYRAEPCKSERRECYLNVKIQEEKRGEPVKIKPMWKV